MKSRSLLLFILFSMLSAACSRKVLIRLERRPQKEEFSFDVSCSSKDCPSFVGGMFRKLNSGQSFCSVSLISPSQILTNAHCIPEDIAKAGSDCEGRIRVAFPKTKDHPSESFHCKRILSVASDYNKNEPDSPDWAVLELDGVSSRKPVAFRRDEIEPHEPVTMYKVDFDSVGRSAIRGRIIKTDCLANSSHLLTDDFIGPISALFSVGNCDPFLKVGNSGSAVLDRKEDLLEFFLLFGLFLHPHPPTRKVDTVAEPMEPVFLWMDIVLPRSVNLMETGTNFWLSGTPNGIVNNCTLIQMRWLRECMRKISGK